MDNFGNLETSKIGKGDAFNEENKNFKAFSNLSGKNENERNASLELLEKYGERKESNDKDYTHMLVFPVIQKYKIRPANIVKFWNEYCDLQSNNNPYLYIAEKNIEVSPLIIQYREAENNDVKLHLISNIQQVIQELYTVSESKKELVCCNLVSLDSRGRLQFPFCQVKISNIQFVLDRIEKLSKEKNPNWEVKLDRDILNRSDLLLYGSRENPDVHPFIIDNYYPIIEYDHIEEIVDIDYFTTEELCKPKHHIDLQKGDIDDFKSENISPLLFSNKYWVNNVVEFKVAKSVKIRIQPDGKSKVEDLNYIQEILEKYTHFDPLSYFPDSQKISVYFSILMEDFIVSIDKNYKELWFYDEKNRVWKETGIEYLRTLMTNVLRLSLEKHRIIYSECARNSSNDYEKGKIEDNISKCDKFIKDICPIVDRCLKYAPQELYHEKFLEKLDSDPDMIALGNGKIVNLKEGWVRDRIKSDYCTKVIRYKHNPNAKSKKIKQALLDWFLNNPRLIRAFQIYIGSCLTGHVRDKILAFFAGDSNSGKSIVINILNKIFGNYHETLQRSILINSEKDEKGGPCPELIALKGARIATVVEMGSIKIGTSTIKQLSGGDEMSGRLLFSNTYVKFKPTAKIIIACETAPAPKESDQKGYWNRVKVFPFEANFVDREPTSGTNERKGSKEFIESLEEEDYEFFLLWMIEGAKIWYEEGLYIPDEIESATKKYHLKSDPVSRFKEDCVEITDGKGDNKRIQCKDLYETYKFYCEENAYKWVSMNKFSEAMISVHKIPFAKPKNKLMFFVSYKEPLPEEPDDNNNVKNLQDQITK